MMNTNVYLLEPRNEEINAKARRSSPLKTRLMQLRNSSCYFSVKKICIYSFLVARLKSTKLGIKLVGGKGHNFIHGDSGIFVSRVRPGSLADGRLYPGDRVVAV